MYVSVTVATARSTPPLTPLPMVPSSDVCQCILVRTARESTPHCQNILGSYRTSNSHGKLCGQETGLD